MLSKYLNSLVKFSHLVLLSFVLCSASMAEHLNRQELRIGVLAKRGPDMALNRWTQMARYLNHMLPKQKFVILPLNFDQVESAVKEHQIDFLLTNSAMFVDLSFDYALFPIATLKRKHSTLALTEFGSVIFTRSDRSEINQLRDLIGQDIAAVDQRSLGGWIAAYRELKNIGISDNQLHSVKFLGIHDAVVYAVKNRIVDIGIVRTDTLERMVQEGKIKLKDFKNIAIPTASSRTNQFPLINSTRLYPEWPIASLQHVPRQLTEQVSSALLLMQSASTAAKDAQIMGWTIPKNYRQVEHAFKELKLGFYAETKELSLLKLIQTNWRRLMPIILLSLPLIFMLLYTRRLRKKILGYKNKLDFQLSHDALTGLANRQKFSELATQQIYLATRAQTSCLLLYLDLDDFKEINRHFGRDFGDKLLIAIADDIAKLVQLNDVFSRIEGDEFLILLANPNSVTNYRKLIQEIIITASQTAVMIDGQKIQSSLSIGVSRFPNQGSQLNDLIKSAEIGLGLAKSSGKSRYFISPD